MQRKARGPGFKMKGHALPGINQRVDSHPKNVAEQGLSGSSVFQDRPFTEKDGANWEDMNAQHARVAKHHVEPSPGKYMGDTQSPIPEWMPGNRPTGTQQMGSSPARAKVQDISTREDDPNIKGTEPTKPKPTGRKTYKQAWEGMSPEKQAEYGGDMKKFTTAAEAWWKGKKGQKKAKTDPKFKHRVTKPTPAPAPKPAPEGKKGTIGGPPADRPTLTAEQVQERKEGAKRYAKTTKRKEKWGVFTSEGRRKIREKREASRAKKAAEKQAKKPAWRRRREERERQNIAIYGEK